MSLYTQSQAPYGQMVYSAPQGYSHQPISNYYPPPPPPQPYYDATYFGRDYMARLSELIVNSRPIIQNLSVIAQDYQRYADTVVQCIETHIRRAPPHTKLPAFYLLDAICKNVYEPYARLFTPVVVRLFLDTYEVVDQNTRQKMDEMLLTWRNGAPNNRELFGVVPQLAIERQIWGGESTQNGSSRNSQQGISTQQVLSELEFVLGQKQRAVQTNPSDTVSANHVNVLLQLRSLVQKGISQDELSQILAQLGNLAQPTQAIVPPPAVQPPPTIPHVFPSQPTYLPPPPTTASHYPPSHPAYPTQPSYSATTYNQPKQEPVPVPIPSAPLTSAAVPAPAAPVVPSNISSLYDALVKAGVVSASATPTGAGATAKAETPTEDSSKQSISAYRQAILNTGIKLNSVDIVKQRPPIVKLLYDNLPSQCKQCGIRFRDDADGKKRHQDHLDAHFHQNRKASQFAGRGHSRSWFISIDDWLHEGTDVKGKARADGPRMNPKAVAAVEAAKRDAELRAMFVVVPPGDEAKSISCPICKEPLKSEFMEDDEEWVWKNAVKKDDRIFHATCHAEAAASKSNLATRLKTEVRSRSRSRTPDVLRTPPRAPVQLIGDTKFGSLSPSKLVGTKRKAEDDDDDFISVKPEQQRTPPNKKLALSATS